MDVARVAVIGGGVTGLVAAHRLAANGHRVTLFEASHRLGGQIRTESFAGLRVDTGAEAIHLAGPHLPALLDEVGLTAHMVDSRPGSAQIWDGRRLRRLPPGVGPTGPTKLVPVLRSRILSPRGVGRAALEPLIGRSSVTGDQSVGDFLDHRFGPQVVDRFVDPLLGNLHGGDVRRLSMVAVAPYLAQQVESHRSLVLAARERRRAGPPSFKNFAGGLGTLTDALTGPARLTICEGASIGGVHLDDAPPQTGQAPCARFRLDGVEGLWDAVVVATAPAAASQLLAELGGQPATDLAATPAATVATVLFAFQRSDVESLPAFAATGLLVPSRARRLLKAATFLTRKWPHLDVGELFVLRASAGRARDHVVEQLDDGELVNRLQQDLGAATGLRAQPVETLVRRWPHAMAQLEIGHSERIRDLRRSLARTPGVVVAGAGIDGLGVASCASSGERAAAAVLEHLVAAQGSRVA